MTMHHVEILGREERVRVGKIVCMGRNYVAHINELNNPMPDAPMFFIKPTTSLAPLTDPILLPRYSRRARHELELAVVLKKELRKARKEDVFPAIDGYAVALDLTLQDIQEKVKEKRHPWEIAKGFDGACPISPFVPAEQVKNPMDLWIRMWVNDQLRHNDSTKLMIYDIPSLVAAASQYFTLEVGDIILTGTPAGVGGLKPGDELIMEIDQVGRYASVVAME